MAHPSDGPAVQAYQRLLESRHARTFPRVYVSDATCCRKAGSGPLLAELSRHLEEAGIACAPAGCTGAHFAHPTVQVVLADGRRGIFHAKDLPVRGFVQELKEGKLPASHRVAVFGRDGAVTESAPFFAGQMRTTLRDAGFCDPTSVDDYLALGGFRGLAQALDLGADAVLELLKLANLRGRGGVGFPLGAKAEFTRKGGSPPRYVAANGEEGEQDTFKDEVLIEATPLSVIEGMAIAALAAGAGEGYFFVNKHYHASHEWVPQALEGARKAGLLGGDILGSSFPFDVKLAISTAGYVSGEESAMLEVIEGRPARPRLRPPFPAQAGLWGRPTLVNNTESLALVPLVLSRGVEWFRSLGPAKSPGTKLLSLLGVPREGVLEVPMGTPVRDVVVRLGGADPASLKAVQIGGPTGGYLLPDALDFTLDFEAKRGHAIMGAGGLVAIKKDVRAVDLALQGIKFMEAGSCGRCTPCREGTHAMRLLVERMAKGEKGGVALSELQQLARDMTSTSICGLGQTAGNAFTAVFEAFRPEIEPYLRG